jgi:hypothetical protein
MKKIIFFLIATFGLISSAQALEGRWQGAGNSQTHRFERPCDLIYFHFRVSDEAVVLLDGGYRCGILQAEYPPSRFTREANGDLSYFGSIVGHFDGVDLVLERPEDFFRVEFNVLENTLHYRELWDDGQSFLSIEGELHPII